MKEIKFRPLRLDKKTGKIIVAGYLQWRRVKVADREPFVIDLVADYKRFDPDAQVYNHKGEALFFPEYDPLSIPVLQHTILVTPEAVEAFTTKHPRCGILWDVGGVTHYNMTGCDCDGVPAFSHKTANEIAASSSPGATEWVRQFEPLTVKRVKMWLGFFLMEMRNFKLKEK